jgi:anti-sigma-K factor RskA
MTSGHETMHELLGLYVLGAVTPTELAEFEAHVAVCEACRTEVAALRPVTAGLARMVPQVDPPAGLRERVIRAAAGPAAMSRGGAALGAPARTAPVLPWLLAAASLVAAVALGYYTIQLRRGMADLEGQLQQARTATEQVQQALTQTEQQIADARRAALEARSQVAVLAAPDLMRFELTGQSNAPTATARAFWSRSRGMVFTASNLPSPPAGRVYQLWVLTAAGTPISVGLLEPDQTGGYTAVFQTPADIPLPALVAVSDEPPGGVPAPTGLIWVAGKPAA